MKHGLLQQAQISDANGTNTTRFYRGVAQQDRYAREASCRKT
jgi:hypothetical protein